MTTQVLITHHHRDAMENAADRGFWMPLPLPLETPDASELMYLTSVSYGTGTIKSLLEISCFEPWRDEDGIARWLPFTGRLIEEATVGSYKAVVPTIRGTAWITGIADYAVDPSDPFPDGFTVGDIWGKA